MTPFANTWVNERAQHQIDPKDGRVWQHAVNEYADPKLNLLLYQLRECEIVQTTHRARILFNAVSSIYNDQSTDRGCLLTWLLSNRELMDAPDSVNIFKWQEVLNLMNEIEARQHYVTPHDLCQGLSMTGETADKYLQLLVDSGSCWLPSSKITAEAEPAKRI